MIVFFIFKSLSIEIVRHELTTIAFLLLIIYSLYVIGHKKRFLILALGFSGIGELFFILSEDYIDSHSLLVLKLIFAVIFFALMTYACLLFTLQDKRISVTTLFGSLCAYLFIGLLWAYLYHLLMAIDSQAFIGITLKHTQVDNEFIYYSFVTLTTLGYGDVVPVGSMAKTLSWIEAYTGQAYLTVLMALLVGRYLQTRKDNE
jgi:Ion channel